MKEPQEFFILKMHHPFSAFLIKTILFQFAKKNLKFNYRHLQIPKRIISWISKVMITWSPFSGMKIQPVYPRQISPYI